MGGGDKKREINKKIIEYNKYVSLQSYQREKLTSKK